MLDFKKLSSIASDSKKISQPHKLGVEAKLKETDCLSNIDQDDNRISIPNQINDSYIIIKMMNKIKKIK